MRIHLFSLYSNFQDTNGSTDCRINRTSLYSSRTWMEETLVAALGITAVVAELAATATHITKLVNSNVG